MLQQRRRKIEMSPVVLEEGIQDRKHAEALFIQCDILEFPPTPYEDAFNSYLKRFKSLVKSKISFDFQEVEDVQGKKTVLKVYDKEDSEKYILFEMIKFVNPRGAELYQMEYYTAILNKLKINSAEVGQKVTEEQSDEILQKIAVFIADTKNADNIRYVCRTFDDGTKGKKPITPGQRYAVTQRAINTSPRKRGEVVPEVVEGGFSAAVAHDQQAEVAGDVVLPWVEPTNPNTGHVEALPAQTTELENSTQTSSETPQQQEQEQINLLLAAAWVIMFLSQFGISYVSAEYVTIVKQLEQEFFSIFVKSYAMTAGISFSVAAVEALIESFYRKSSLEKSANFFLETYLKTGFVTLVLLLPELVPALYRDVVNHHHEIQNLSVAEQDIFLEQKKQELMQKAKKGLVTAGISLTILGGLFGVGYLKIQQRRRERSNR